jgi:serine/threonine protein kinase
VKSRKRLTETETRPILAQALTALEYMHSNGMVHRDVKVSWHAAPDCLPPSPPTPMPALPIALLRVPLWVALRAWLPEHVPMKLAGPPCVLAEQLENILFTAEGAVKLADFGFSTVCRNPAKKLKVFCGTPSYMAPEIVQKKCVLATTPTLLPASHRSWSSAPPTPNPLASPSRVHPMVHTPCVGACGWLGEGQ